MQFAQRHGAQQHAERAILRLIKQAFTWSYGTIVS
jgi:hypothetical protein